MGIETPINGIWSLDESWPLTSDSRREGDDHLRLIKEAIKKTFANINAVVDCTDEELNILAGAVISTAELNYLDGVTSNIQSQLDDTTIMRDNQDNTVTGFFFIDGDILYIDRDNATTARIFQRIRNASSTNKAAFYLFSAIDATRPDAFAILNGSDVAKFVIRQDALVLEQTSTDLLWNTNAVATESYVDTEVATCAKNADFIREDKLFDTTAALATFTLDTGFGSDDFQWAISGIRRADGTQPKIKIFAVDDNDFTQHFVTDSSLADPIEPAIASAGKVNFAVVGDTAGIISWVMRFWARKDI